MTPKLLKFATAVALGFGLVGCEQALFPEGLPRTQFERYDRLRGRYVSPDQANKFGGSEPALRDRLSPYRPYYYR